MKKILIILIGLILSISAFSQRTQLDFTMQMQNSNQHEAVIYPNPISEPVFSIKSPSSVITKVEVINMIGKVFYTKDIQNYSFNDISVRLPQIDKGIYLVRITFDDNQIIIKKLFYQ